MLLLISTRSEQPTNVYQPMGDAIHEGLIRLTQKLIAFDGSDTSLLPLPPTVSADDIVEWACGCKPVLACPDRHGEEVKCHSEHYFSCQDCKSKYCTFTHMKPTLSLCLYAVTLPNTT